MDLNAWLQERLNPIAEAQFACARHRVMPEVCARVASASYFSVPLATGTGQGILAQPRDKNTQHKALVILLHGLGEDCTYPYWHWIEALVSAGFPVFAFDWDGHGEQGNSTLDFALATRSIPLILQRIYGERGASTLDSVREGPPCFLMGQSAGAVLALTAATRPDIAQVVRGVVAISPLVHLRQGASLRDLTCRMRFAKFLGGYVPHVSHYGLAGILPIRQAAVSKDLPLNTRMGIDPVGQARAFAEETFEQRRILRNVRVPVLWLHSARDRLTPWDKAERLASEIPSSLFMYTDASRGPQHLAFSRRITSYVGQFFERLLDATTHF